MDIRVQELLERIKREGVESAEAQAAAIVADAETRRSELIAVAEKEGKAIIERAKVDAARTEEAGKAALVQASRDLILAFRGEMEKLLAGIVKSDVDAAFDSETLRKALPSILEAWSKDGRDELSVLVPEKELKSLEAFFRDKLDANLRKGVEFKPLKDTKSGFRLVEKGGAVYYDFTAQAVADMLGAYLNTRLAAIVASSIASEQGK
jgi:V/A-type H+-transporting ATPase subunit E